jgi:ABC-type uncharacterized transport system substrate-binding protein
MPHTSRLTSRYQAGTPAACFTLFAFAGVARAQQQPPPLHHIGVLLAGFSLESKEAQEFRQGLRDAGYSEGRDVAIEWRSTDIDQVQVPELVDDLVQRKVDVIVVKSTAGADAAQHATSTISIVLGSSVTDKPWADHFCCMVTSSKEFVHKNPSWRPNARRERS